MLKTILLQWTPPILIQLARRWRSTAFAESDTNVLNDAYIPWLCTVVGGWLTPIHGNIRAFDYAIRNMPVNGAVIEIGSFLGLSANIITYLLWKYHRENLVFTCDPWVFEETEKRIGGYFDAGSEQYRAYAKDVFKLNTTIFSEPRIPHSIEMFSEEFLARWKQDAVVSDIFGRTVKIGGPISFAYIDGAHTYEATKADFEGINPFVLPGGYVLFDDSADGVGLGSSLFARELTENPDYRIVFKTPHYFFQKISA